MANEPARGRPVAALVLSAEERGYLERQVLGGVLRDLCDPDRDEAEGCRARDIPAIG